jgi:hypothetical protein
MMMATTNDPPSLQSQIQSKVQRKARRLRRPVTLGLYVGALMILALFAGLVAANRIPSLEPYALERNAASYGALLLLMLVPVIRFFRRPALMYVTAMVSWCMFSTAYYVAGFYFRNLFDVLRPPLQVLIEGNLLYGLLAVMIWVAGMALHARTHPLTPRRRRTDHFTIHHRR